jgi:hypothetical protein
MRDIEKYTHFYRIHRRRNLNKTILLIPLVYETMTTDLKFNSIVTHVRKKTDDTSTIIGFQVLCSSCGKYNEVERDEFNTPDIPDEAHLKYVAKMRAWNCCHSGEDPYDGYPTKPEFYGATQIGTIESP